MKKEIAFDELKARVMKVSIFAHFNFELKTIVKSNSSNFIFAEVLLQKNVNDIIKSVVFFFKSLLSTKCNYEIYDKKLLVIICCFEEWRLELQFVFISIKMLIDYKSLKYFMTIKKLNRRQVRWTKFLADFNFIINYQLRKFHAKTNSFIQRSKNRLISDKNDRQKQQLQTILISNRLNNDIKRKISETMMINEIKDSTSTHIAAIDSLDHSFDKIIVFEKKQLALIRKIHD